MTDARYGRPRRPWRRAVLVVPVVTGLVLLGTTAWGAHRASQVHGSLSAAAGDVSGLHEALVGGDAEEAQRLLASVQRDTAVARRATEDPVWRLGGLLPVVGDDVRAVGTTARAVDDIAVEVLPRLAETAAAVDPSGLVGADGGLRLRPLRDALPALTAAEAAAEAARADLAAVETGTLRPEVAAPLREARAGVDDLARVTATGARLAALLPSMGGVDEPRSYMVLVQNNAELRATGGIPGAWAVVTVDDGALSLGAVGSAFPPTDEPVLPLADADVALHGDRLGRYLQSTTATPHFPVAATLAAEMLRRRTGVEVDGVLSVDPVALSYVLAGTGPVRLPGGDELTSENAVPLLLSDAYARFDDPADQDAFFAGAASATFDVLASGGGDRAAVLDGLRRAGEEGRLLVWSARPEEQRRLAGSAVAGDLPASGGPDVGVFLDDATEAKLGYYLSADVVLSRGCSGDGSGAVETVLTSGVPDDALPDYVTGTRLPPERRGDALTNVLVYGPVGGGFRSVTVDGEEAVFTSVVDRGRPVALVRVVVPRGGRTAVVADLAGLRADEPTLRVTPMAQPARLTTPSACV